MTGRRPNCCLQAVGVELGLLLPDAWVPPGALRLDQRQRLAVVAPEHVVHEPLPSSLGMPVTRILAVTRLVERPARLLEQQVDEVVARLGLGIVVVSGSGCSSFCYFLNLGFEGLDFFYRPGQFRILGGQSGVFFHLLGLQLCQLLGVAVGDGAVLLWDFGDVEERFADGRRIGRIAGQPVEDVKELFESVEGIAAADRLVAVDGQVADFLDGEDLEERARVPGSRGRLVRGSGRPGCRHRVA